MSQKNSYLVQPAAKILSSGKGHRTMKETVPNDWH